MGDIRSPRRPHPRSDGISTSQIGSVAATAGSMCSRQGLLDAGCRVESRGWSPAVDLGSALGPVDSGGRSPVLKAARPAMGGDILGPPQRARILPQHEAKSGQEVHRGNRSPKAEGESKGQEQTLFRRRGQRQLSRGACLKAEPAGRCDTKKAAVPGSSAPTFSVGGFWNSLPRMIRQRSDGFGAFFGCMCSVVPSSRNDEGTPGAVLWPMPLPYPEAFRSGPLMPNTWRKRRLCLQIGLLCWLKLGRPSSAPGCISLGRRLTSRQWSTVKLLEQLSEDVNSPMVVDAAQMGRVASKVESSSFELLALHRAVAFLSGGGSNMNVGKISSVKFEDTPDAASAFGCVCGHIKQEAFVAAKQVEADRLTFVGRPEFDPGEMFDHRTLQVYDDPISHAVVHEAPLAPTVRVLASRDEKIKLYRRLAETGRLTLMDPGEVNVAYGAGLFSVLKDLSRDRLILDARPANSREIPLCSWTRTLASPSTLALVELAEDEVLLSSGQDLRDYFYQFKVSRKRAARNCLVGILNREDMLEIFGPEQTGARTEGVAALSTLAMGDCSACEFAQGSHVLLLLACGALRADELLQTRLPPPRGSLSVGVVIDDLVVLEKVLKRDLEAIHSGRLHTFSDERIRLALEGYSSNKLLTNEKKSFHNAENSSFWGIELDGVAGLIRPSSSRLLPLIGITMRVVCLGLATCGLLESLAGSFISIFLVRRRLMCSMNLIFDAVSACSSPGDVVRLSSKLKDELISFCLLSSMCWMNLRARTMDGLRATDASDWGMAAVRAELGGPYVREFLRHSLLKSVWSQLLPASKAWLRTKGLLEAEAELPEEVFDVHPLWEILARALVYKELWRRPHRRPVHINIGELRAHLQEEERLIANHSSSRVLFGLDSQVALGCLVKGRSSSRALNSELMKSLPNMIGSDLYGYYLFFPSATNRADGPTRGAAPQDPDVPLPSWWESLGAGNYGTFDAWLQRISDKADFVVDGQLRGEMIAGASDLRSSARVKKDNYVNEASPGADDVAPLSGGVPCVSSPCEDVGTLCEESLKILATFSDDQVLWGNGVDSFNSPAPLDLYSGKAGVARALVRGGCPWVIAFEWLRSSQENLLDKNLQGRILRLIILRAVRVVGSAMICSSFTVAITPPVRTSRYPRGVPWMSSAMKPKVKDGNLHCDFNKEVIFAADSTETYFWLENPDTSWLWRQRGYQRFRAPDSQWTLRVDYCRFGTPWKKRTRVGCNLPGLCGLRLFCRGRHNHVPLRGNSKFHKKPWTLVAQPYPRGGMWVELSAFGCGWMFEKLGLQDW